MTMAGEFDFEPESDDVLNGIADDGKPMGSYVHVCRELRAWRGLGRKLQGRATIRVSGAWQERNPAVEALAGIRALVAHVGGGEE